MSRHAKAENPTGRTVPALITWYDARIRILKAAER